MRSYSLISACSLLVGTIAIPHYARSNQSNPYSLPQYSPNRTGRASEVAKRNATFLYGPGACGGPWSPTGSLGEQYVSIDSNITNQALYDQEEIINSDQIQAEGDASIYQNLKTVDDYTKLYADGNWAKSSAPTGIDPGVLTNYTSDLLFSMQRLSWSPYLIRRLDPFTDELPFDIVADVTRTLAGCEPATLLTEGRLFYADYRFLENYEHGNVSMRSAFTDALFYISPLSGDFLPLAIRTNANNRSLVYTPLDTANDWLLAKMMFNVDNSVVESFHHLAATHYVVEIVYEAAIKTLSVEHPILPILARAMYGAFGIRPLAEETLFQPGQAVDTFLPWTGQAMQNFTADMYFSGSAGSWSNNYFRTDLERRGLLNPKTGPPLKSFPFYEDAVPIHDAQHQFMQTFVYSYYSSDGDLKNDNELQSWLVEANGPAQVIDFPSTLNDRDSLVDLLTHFAHLTTTAHHAVNLNQLVTASTVLPLNPTAIYQPIPTEKGVDNVAAYLPPLEQCFGIIEFGANFARPLLAGGPRAMVYLFDDPAVLARMNPAVRAANEVFKQDMLARSQVVAARTFDAQGLSQGMPFVWKALDPLVMLFSTTI